MKLKMSDIHKEKAILPSVSVLLLLAYMYLTFVFRPTNTVSFPNVEDRIFTAFLIFFIASVLAYAKEIYLSAKPALGKVFSRLAAPFSKIHIGLKKKAHPVLNRHVSNLRKLVKRIGIKKKMAFVFSYSKKNFYSGKPYYFATLGLAVFLIISPLVIYNQKELVEPAVLLFITFVAFSYWEKLDDRVMIVSALLFLLSYPFLLIMNEGARAELAAIYAYYALCAGVFLQFANLFRKSLRVVWRTAKNMKKKWHRGLSSLRVGNLDKNTGVYAEKGN